MMTEPGRFPVYIHGDKEHARYLSEEYGIPYEDILTMIREIKLEIFFDPKTKSSWIASFNDIELED